MDTPSIVVLLGSGREGRQSEKVARYVFSELQKREDMTVEYADVRSFGIHETIPGWEESKVAQPWRDLVQRADGFVVVIPEYNRGYPGELKLLLDSAYREYERKPVALVGVSSGVFGGGRVIDHIKPVLTELGMVVIKAAAHFPSVGALFDANGIMTDASYAERVSKLADELVWYASALKTARVMPPQQNNT